MHFFHFNTFSFFLKYKFTNWMLRERKELIFKYFPKRAHFIFCMNNLGFLSLKLNDRKKKEKKVMK